MAHIITVPAFSDNYIWLICDENKQYAAIVDPGMAAPVINALEEESIQPVAILLTHFHYDHVNGIPELLERYPDLPIYGPARERDQFAKDPNRPEYGPASANILRITHPLDVNDEFTLDKIESSFKVLDFAGHTAGHIGYLTGNKLFCGDTLFAAGCGRIFNGTFEQLHDSLQRIKELPEETLIFCAHEYTLDNLGFAKLVEPDNTDILDRQDADMGLIDDEKATVPSTLALELKTNPFLRTDNADVIQKVAEATGKSLANSTEVFAAMRIWKDTKYD